MAVKKISNSCEDAKKEEYYYDLLYKFAVDISKANEKSFDGYEPYIIANDLRKSLESFFELCMYDPDLITLGKQRFSEKIKQEVAEELKVAEQKQQEKKVYQGKFLQIDAEGWGLCPVCGTKVLKVTSITRLENFPVYCKRCKADHLVNWWNAKQQKILYRRYTNDNAIRDKALKGTGLKQFMYTGSSATEKAVIGK